MTVDKNLVIKLRLNFRHNNYMILLKIAFICLYRAMILGRFTYACAQRSHRQSHDLGHPSI